jgi:hypothetical protein
MIKSKYLQNVVEEHSELRKATAKRSLTTIILFASFSIISYFGISSLDSRATSVAIMLSGVFGLICLILLVKFMQLIGEISDKVISKCEKEIENNLKSQEQFETFDNDMAQAAFGEYDMKGYKIRVGYAFVLFQYLTNKGPSFHILRADNLGNFDVHYSSQGGVGTDIGMDIKDKNGKFIRSIMTSDKELFYKVLNAMESIKSYANGEDIAAGQDSINQENPFVEQVKNKVAQQDRKGSTKLGIAGIFFGFFLFIAGSSSGVVFSYAGLALIIISITFIIVVNVKRKTH